MKRFWEAVVKYDRMGEKGTPITVKETFITETVSLTDTEVTMTQEITPFSTGNILVISAKISKYSEFVPAIEMVNQIDIEAKKITGQKKIDSEASTKFFAVKISLIVLDESSGKEKKVKHNMLVEAISTESATELMYLHMKDTMSEWEINDIVETKIVDVILAETSE